MTETVATSISTPNETSAAPGILRSITDSLWTWTSTLTLVPFVSNRERREARKGITKSTAVTTKTLTETSLSPVTTKTLTETSLSPAVEIEEKHGKIINEEIQNDKEQDKENSVIITSEPEMENNLQHSPIASSVKSKSPKSPTKKLKEITTSPGHQNNKKSTPISSASQDISLNASPISSTSPTVNTPIAKKRKRVVVEVVEGEDETDIKKSPKKRAPKSGTRKQKRVKQIDESTIETSGKETTVEENNE